MRRTPPYQTRLLPTDPSPRAMGCQYRPHAKLPSAGEWAAVLPSIDGVILASRKHVRYKLFQLKEKIELCKYFVLG